jgi:hypothetical protein
VAGAEVLTVTAIGLEIMAPAVVPVPRLLKVIFAVPALTPVSGQTAYPIDDWKAQAVPESEITVTSLEYA